MMQYVGNLTMQDNFEILVNFLLMVISVN